MNSPELVYTGLKARLPFGGEGTAQSEVTLLRVEDVFLLQAKETALKFGDACLNPGLCLLMSVSSSIFLSQTFPEMKTPHFK